MAAPARLIEEYYKILRSGYAERTFQGLAEHGLLEPVTPELQRAASDEAWRDALDALDSYRQRFETAPPTLTNAILLGTMLVPIGLMPARQPPRATTRCPHERWAADEAGEAEAAHDEEPGESLEEVARQSGRWRGRRKPPKEPQLKIGLLPIARRDVDRLRQVLALQRRLLDLESPARVKRTIVHRGPFAEALTWLEIHGHEPEVLEHWRGFVEALCVRTPHELHERVDALSGKRVVDRRAHPAHRAMALQAVEPGGRDSFTNFFSSSSLGSRNVMFICERVLLRRAAVEARAIDLRVELAGLAGVDAADGLEPALGERPLHHEPHQVDAEAGRRVVHRLVLGVRRVAQHRVQRLRRALQQVLADDDERDARRAEVLLRARRRSARTSRRRSGG
jgi:hypothetical protein